MGKNSNVWQDARRVVMVMEVVHDGRGESGAVELVYSIPGRESTLTKRWRCRYGIPDDDQLQDMTAQAGKTLQQALISWTGVQMPLRGSP